MHRSELTVDLGAVRRNARTLLRSLPAGAAVELRLLRAGARLTVQVHLRDLI